MLTKERMDKVRDYLKGVEHGTESNPCNYLSSYACIKCGWMDLGAPRITEGEFLAHITKLEKVVEVMRQIEKFSSQEEYDDWHMTDTGNADDAYGQGSDNAYGDCARKAREALADLDKAGTS